MKKLLIGILIAIGAFVLVLLVIDIQEGTTGSVSPRESYVQQAEALISNTNRCIGAAREKGWKVIYIRSEVVNPLIKLLNNSMARGSQGAELNAAGRVVDAQIELFRKLGANILPLEEL